MVLMLFFSCDVPLSEGRYSEKRTILPSTLTRIQRRILILLTLKHMAASPTKHILRDSRALREAQQNQLRIRTLLRIRFDLRLAVLRARARRLAPLVHAPCRALSRVLDAFEAALLRAADARADFLGEVA